MGKRMPNASLQLTLLQYAIDEVLIIAQPGEHEVRRQKAEGRRQPHCELRMASCEFNCGSNAIELEPACFPVQPFLNPSPYHCLIP
jgi:hypothetical protein